MEVVQTVDSKQFNGGRFKRASTSVSDPSTARISFQSDYPQLSNDFCSYDDNERFSYAPAPVSILVSVP